MSPEQDQQEQDRPEQEQPEQALPEQAPTDQEPTGQEVSEQAPQEAPEHRPTPQAPPPQAPIQQDRAQQEGEASGWGRVDADGTVYVRTADGERSVGQYPEGSPDEALAFYTRRYDALAFEVELLEKRVHAGNLTPEEARQSIDTVRTQVSDAAAVGDLASLGGRLDALGPVVAQQQSARREERAKRQEQARADKERIVVAAEKVAAGRDWRGGANRLRDLLEEWKALPRIDRASDDALWKRFSGARTSFTRARKTHFAEVSTQRESAKVTKERLVREAEALSGSTDWGPTAGRYRDLMRDWKAAGPAPKAEDDALWQRFRAAQDAFFDARTAANDALDAEFAANAVVKEQILVEAEALLPVRDLATAKRRLRDLGERWEAAGKVPRARIRELEGRMRKVEETVRSAEDEQWQRTDPEKSARADDMVSTFARAVERLERDLDQARTSGDASRAARMERDLEGQRAMLEMARKAAADFS